MIPTLDPDILRTWVGRSETRLDQIGAEKARLMQATLDVTPTLQDGNPLPPLWHWLYFVSDARLQDLAPDGLAALGPLFPPIDLPNRMWAGARFEFEQPLRIGQMVEKHSEVMSVAVKQGRSGPLCFVTLRDTYRADAITHFTETFDLVYRTAPSNGAPKSAPEVPYREQFSEEVMPTETQLFRYSALTFNSHRIHYDLDYCREVESYPGLIVHGPLTATLLIAFAQRHTETPIKRFRLRATAPLFVPHAIRLSGRRIYDRLHVWASSSEGVLAMDAETDFHDGNQS